MSAISDNGMAGGSRRTSVAGRIPATGSAAAVTAPQLCPTTWTSGTSSAAAPDPCRDIGSVVADAMVPDPVAGEPMTGQVDRDHPPAGRGERGTDPPPDPRRGRHAMDQDQRTIVRVAPRER